MIRLGPSLVFFFSRSAPGPGSGPVAWVLEYSYQKCTVKLAVWSKLDPI